jgi:putative SOS response-associated peptidase YedK
MCGRYTDTRRDKRVLVRMGVAHASEAQMDFVPRYNIAPTQEASILVHGANGIELRRARWGLIPAWAKDEKIGNSLINARADTVAVKPAYRESFRKRRCLVIADGFYEWQQCGAVKQPYYFRLHDGAQFAFAGLWDKWNDLESFSIVTVPPNELVSSIADRMPLILREEFYDKWLEPETPVAELNSVLKPYRAAEMESWPVRPLVNSPRNDTPECVAPLPAEQVPPAQAEFGL